MAVVPGVSSFGNYLTRMSDQNVYNYAITGSQDQWFREVFDVEGDIPLAIRGFLQSIQQSYV